MRAKVSPRPLAEVVEAFLLQKQVNGCSPRTVAVYKWWLDRLAAVVPDMMALDSIALTRFFGRLRDRGMSPSTLHQTFRTFRTFTRWLIATGAFRRNPLDGLAIRTPKTLPAVPSDEELDAVLRSCPDSPAGIRNYAAILMMADAGLRASEALHLLIEDWRPADRSLFVRSGKGARDRVVFIGATTARALKAWLSVHPQPAPETWLFCQHDGRPLTFSGPTGTLPRLTGWGSTGSRGRADDKRDADLDGISRPPGGRLASGGRSRVRSGGVSKKQAGPHAERQQVHHAAPSTGRSRGRGLQIPNAPDGRDGGANTEVQNPVENALAESA